MKEIIDWVSNNSEIIFRNKGEYKQWAPGIYRFVFMPKGHGKQQVYVRLLPGEKKIIFVGFMPRPTAHINDHNSLKIELKRYLIDLSGIKTYEDFKKKGIIDIFEPNKAMAVPLHNKTIDFAMSNQWSKESIQARKLEVEKIRAGFSYDETKNYYYLWRKAPLDSKPKVPNGFWKSEKTAINYLLAVLDENLSQDPNGPKIASNKSVFKNAREAGDIKKMAELYRFYVIEKGQNNFFDKQGGMAGLIRNFSPFLDKRGPGVLLRLASKPGGALEGLVDANNKDALKPWEIEEDYWNEQTAASAVINALKWYVPGFELAMNEENAKTRIKEMARLYRKTVIEYPGTTQKYLGGQVRFFYEVAQLSGLIEHSRPFLDKKLSAAALLRLATKHDEKLNGLVDANNKDALKPWEIEENYWNKTRAAAAVVNALKWYVPGFEVAMNEKNAKVRIKEMARLYLKYVKNSKADPELDPPQTRNGQQGFYYRAQLANLMKDQSFLHKTASGGALLRLAVELTSQLKGMIDDNNPEALHLQDIERDLAMSSPLVGPQNGGIDLTPSNMNLQTQNAGGGIKFHMDPAMLAQLQNAPGFVPIIINIQPLTDLRIFLGLENQKT